MALIGISLLVASFVIFCLRPPAWVPNFLTNLRQGTITAPPPPPPRPPVAHDGGDTDEETKRGEHERSATMTPPPPPAVAIQEPEPTPIIDEPHEEIHAVPPVTIQGTPRFDITEPPQQEWPNEEEQTTPKAVAASIEESVPSLILPEPTRAPHTEAAQDPPSPKQSTPRIATTPSPPPPTQIPSPKSASDLMPPPPAPRVPRNITPTKLRQPSPSVLMPPPPVPVTKKPRASGIPVPASSSPSNTPPRRIPTLAGPSATTPVRARNLPIPSRGGASGASSGGLAPPPTATSIPKKPSRQVTLAPGHSPLDWARLAQSPTSDLRNLPPGTPYLRVTPSMLKQQNGRKGRDAWTVYGGKVYNVSPYVAFHPGGGPELLRGAGKDGTKLFAEVHPWVNYETMLASCLIGLLVEEGEGINQMEEMD